MSNNLKPIYICLVFLFFVLLSDMAVNTSYKEEIDRRVNEELSKCINYVTISVEEFKIEESKNKEEFKDHAHRYYDGKIR